MFQKVTIIGAGYVGISLAVLLSKKVEVSIYDIDNKKIKSLKDRQSPITDNQIQSYLSSQKLKLSPTSELDEALLDTNLIILSLPTNFIERFNHFDTSIIEKTLAKLDQRSHETPIVIKSTVPFGFTEKIQKKFKRLKIIFCPEFLREGSALEDNINPSRIIVGDKSVLGIKIKDFFKSFSKNNPETLLMTSSEAEAVKLFSNTYLANRVSFFNELDSFCLDNNIDSKLVINGVSSDSRIGSFYNNPSFGYGGYCLPKDTKQLLVNFKDTPQSLISSIIESNKIRKDYIAKKIIEMKPKTVGIYRIVMKKDSDNYRDSAILDIKEVLELNQIEVYIFEPFLDLDSDEFNTIESLDEFKSKSEIIIANRIDEDIEDSVSKVFTRDVFKDN